MDVKSWEKIDKLLAESRVLKKRSKYDSTVMIKKI